MRLGYVTRSFPFAHLGETFLTPEVRSLSSLCDELHVIAARPKLRAATASIPGENVRFVRAAAPSLGMLCTAAAEALRNPRRTFYALRRILSPRYRLSAKVKNLTVFPASLAVARYVRTHAIDHIHAHWLTTPSTVAYVASMLTEVPWSCTAHAHDIFADNLPAQKLQSARFVRVIAERNLLHLARIAHAPVQTLHLLHVGVEIPERIERTTAARPLQIVCSARLDPIKGHEYLIAGLAEARNRGLPFHCDIVGDGPSEHALRSQIGRLELGEHVTMRGRVAYADLLGELNGGRYDVLALVSVEFDAPGQHEGIPVALIEAMANGVPCVASATGCIPELIDRSCGILVPQRDSAAIAQALFRLGTDPSLRQMLAENARTRVASDFDVAATSSALYALLGTRGTRGREPVAAAPCSQ